MANRSEHLYGLSTAFTNNTFSLQHTEKCLRKAVENSFNYLMGLQKSYIDVGRFRFTQDDAFINEDGYITITVPRNIIDLSKRKNYKTGDLYNRYFTILDITADRNMFVFCPFVAMDNGYVGDFLVKTTMDETIDICLTDIIHTREFFEETHVIDIILFRDPKVYQFSANSFVVGSYDWVLPELVTGISEINDVAFLYMDAEDWIDTRGDYPIDVRVPGSNVFMVKLTGAGLELDKNNATLYDYISENREIKFTVITFTNFFKADEGLPIARNIYTNKKSATTVLAKEEFESYRMPIPVSNVIFILRNIITGECKFINDREVTLHYPNIYEIDAEDIDENTHVFDTYYFYREFDELLHYENYMYYIFRLFAHKYDLSYKEVVQKLMYTVVPETYIQDHFFNVLNYVDETYVYNFADFFDTKVPFDFDYKTEKMQEFVRKDPMLLKFYGEKVAAPTESFYLDVRTIDLNERIRTNNYQEVESEIDKEEFGMPCYMFSFRNETNSHLQVRFFIDGLIEPAFFQLHNDGIEYFYIPAEDVKANSYIEIEKFNPYTFYKKTTFSSINNEIILEFPSQEMVKPTLFDLFIVDEDNNRISRESFNIKALVKDDEYDISDYIVSNLVELYLDNVVTEDPITGEFYVDINEAFAPDGISIPLENDIIEERLPVKYLFLRKLKIVCINPDLYGKTLKFAISKIPYMSSKLMLSSGLPKIRLFNGVVPWNEDKSFVRIFINGRFIPVNFDIYNETPTDMYFIPRCLIDPGEVITCDISTFSYELEYKLDTIPEDFVISFKNHLSKPFSFKYYDLYLNGRKLNPHNAEIITADKIKLFNVHSIYNFRVYRKDRDWEYYGFDVETVETVDEVLNSNSFLPEDKESLIDDIIGKKRSGTGEIIEPGDNTEEKVQDKYDISDEDYERYTFYYNVIIPAIIARPNTFSIDYDVMEKYYKAVLRTYGNTAKDRVVMRPNINRDVARKILMIGKSDDGFTSILDDLFRLIGDLNELAKYTDGTIMRSLREIYERMNYGRFLVDDSNNVSYEIDHP